MSLTRIVLAWLACSAWFALADVFMARLRGSMPSSRGPLPYWVPAVEGLLFTLFAALWFGSYGPGRGGWILVFLLLGLLLELPGRLKDGAQRSQPRGLAAAVAIGAARWLVAGGIAALVI
jgi:hypothetical protein